MILEAKDKSCSSNEVLAFNLFDEFWFFNNIVNGTKIMFHSSSTREDREKLQHYNLLPAPSLLTTPSLPPRPTSEVLRSSNYINHNLQQDAPLNRSSKTTRLARSISTINYAKHNLQDDAKLNPSSKSIRLARSVSSINYEEHNKQQDGKFNPSSKSSGIERGVTISKPPKLSTNEASLRKAFQEKKWKSLSDLELEELQGFKDLGFVFDNSQLSASLMKVAPGLRQQKMPANENENNNTRKPYLSEAWLLSLRRSETPKLRWADQKSAEDKKKQLRSWVRALASNVRQEC
ncbi:uncharacterized protein LOC120261848 isoform X1 [Dioscorea cayenensis subsp. rotundata]|uniref:Uncharacterized protein LOC120261848 isoform X1 n=1 Tax=Dioscorea cayennensis subsp. rotundata TaxID=55577 RepID=A0AB40BG03_DIOCR|nr:uncharacterized protein LOC120261848 isoform X1 [Dioscorea cayenensis subsp. rotundata]